MILSASGGRLKKISGNKVRDNKGKIRANPLQRRKKRKRKKRAGFPSRFSRRMMIIIVYTDLRKGALER
ncbi:hypothetical protein I7I50_10280 [Histoplasma capsulatum G186AR]|uniref:Uncharacterized protein n=1 Tax=Ajellomyces capsulatus TaxID=5037 RepID=A0A8H7Z7D9_AJECA|nr:hypothetical protein I7I52_01519 [Histoplasma capsulatum]QSS69100.1 hypothetical protein I7I50_10280 [Histoplasma capsulatum G186AR]